MAIKVFKADRRLWFRISVFLFVLLWFLPIGSFLADRPALLWISLFSHLSDIGETLAALAFIGLFTFLFAVAAAVVGWVLQCVIVMFRGSAETMVFLSGSGLIRSSWTFMGLYLIALLLCYNLLLDGLLRWERSTTTKYITAVSLGNAKELDAVLWPYHFKAGEHYVISSWTTDFGDFPSQASSTSTRSIDMPDGEQKQEDKLFLLSPVVPVVRHRLDLRIGSDGSVLGARYDTRGCYFAPGAQGGGSFTNQGLSFGLYIPVPVLAWLAGIAWLLSAATRVLIRYLHDRKEKRHPPERRVNS